MHTILPMYLYSLLFLCVCLPPPPPPPSNLDWSMCEERCVPPYTLQPKVVPLYYCSKQWGWTGSAERRHSDLKRVRHRLKTKKGSQVLVMGGSTWWWRDHHLPSQKYPLGDLILELFKKTTTESRLLMQ